MGNRQLDVSVVIPCFNGAPYLAETLQSVLRQTLLPREVLVVDDGSTDESASIAEAFGAPVRVIRQKNQGESTARNRGIDEAVGEWVALLDADDLWEPEKLEKQSPLLTPDAIGSFTPYREFSDSSKSEDFELAESADYCHSLEAILVGRSQPNTSTVIVRRSLPTRFPEWTKDAEDMVYFLDLLKYGQLVPTQEALTLYRRHPRSQSKQTGVTLRWAQTAVRWVAMQPEELQPQYMGYLGKRIEFMLHKTFWQRDWEAYASFERFLAENAALRSKTIQYPKKRFPSWAYRWRDSWDNLIGKGR